MAIQIIDHNFRPWLAKKRQENGAATYSNDILDILMPKLTGYLDRYHEERNILISTAPPLAKVEDPYILHDPVELVIQFLHTYPYRTPMVPINALLNRFPNSKVILVTAYQSYLLRMQMMLRKEGLQERVKPVFVPMFIQPKKILVAIGKRWFRHDDEKRIIYFGNLYKAKSQEYFRVKQGLERAGWKVDVFSKGKLNGQNPVWPQADIWKHISGYRYGIGVGRCALEMYSLGLKVLISGEHWGGLCMTDDHFAIQTETNFNGRIITGTRDLHEAIELLPHSLEPMTLDPVPDYKSAGIIDAAIRLLEKDSIIEK